MQMTLNPNSVCLLQMPAYTYKKGMLYLSEVNALKNIGDLGVYFDRKCKALRVPLSARRWRRRDTGGWGNDEHGVGLNRREEEEEEEVKAEEEEEGGGGVEVEEEKGGGGGGRLAQTSGTALRSLEPLGAILSNLGFRACSSSWDFFGPPAMAWPSSWGNIVEDGGQGKPYAPVAAGPCSVDAAATPPRAFKVERHQWPWIVQWRTIWRSESHRSFKVERSTWCQEPTPTSSRREPTIQGWVDLCCGSPLRPMLQMAAH
eukprot:9493998-Pyramimonas_sp.AAC.4